MTGPTSTTYHTSHIGYSQIGQLITWGTLPWIAAVYLLLPDAVGVGAVAQFVVALLPGAVWLAAKTAGRGRMGWFYRQPATVSFSPAGIDWRSHLPGTPMPVGHFEWSQLDGLTSSRFSVWVIGPEGRTLGRIPSDLVRIHPSDGDEEWSFAQALVAYRPQDFVTADPVHWDLPLGAKRREPDEPASAIVPAPPRQPMERSEKVQLAIYFLVYLVIGVIRFVIVQQIRRN